MCEVKVQTILTGHPQGLEGGERSADTTQGCTECFTLTLRPGTFTVDGGQGAGPALPFKSQMPLTFTIQPSLNDYL